MTVLILADGEDLTAGRVAAELAGRGIPVRAVDAADFPLRLIMSAAIRTGETWSGSIAGLADIASRPSFGCPLACPGQNGCSPTARPGEASAAS